MEDYRIGPVSVRMTDAQAERWNSGNTTRQDMFSIRAYIPGADRRGLPIHDEMPLAKAMMIHEYVRDAIKGNNEAEKE